VAGRRLHERGKKVQVVLLANPADLRVMPQSCLASCRTQPSSYIPVRS